MHALLGRQIAAPIIGIAFEHDPLAWLYLCNFIRARANRGLQRGFVEMFRIYVLLWQDRHDREYKGQFAVADAGQVVMDRVIVGRGHRFDERKGRALLRTALGFQELEAKRYVRRSDRGSVGEVRAWIEVKSHERAVGIGLDRLRN